MSSLLGRLNLDAIPHDPITLGGGISMIVVGGLVFFALLYFKRLGWLFKNWFSSLDHKKIGVMYIAVSLLMLLRGLIDTGMLRLQQAIGTSDAFLTADHFQQVTSAHGTIMIFFVAMGFVFGIANLIVPLQIGARDVAFPFLNSLSFWLFAVGVALINVSLIVGEFSAAGWLAYPPLSGLEFSPGVGVDYWIWSLQIAGIGSLLSGINFVVTILKMRAPGMNLMKMPIFVWSMLSSMTLVIGAFPILTATLLMLSLDRLLGMHFFTSGFGGNPMMYVNLIWAWGHPEVYILVLPAFGIFSEIVATFSKKPLFGYKSMVVALWAIVILSFTVWLHHFFTMGSGAAVNTFFGIMTMIIAIPTGVKVFNWIFTMYRGRVTFATPMLWFMGFIVTFTIGGLAGVMMSVPPADFQFHNSLFLVAHYHNVIIGGVIFGLFAGISYWWPKFTGFRLNERLGKIAFWMWISGFMVAFMPLYVLGFMGATRRLDHYDPSLGWQGLFVVAGFGVLIIMAGLGTQVIQIAYSVWKRKEHAVGPDPWDGRTLEWATSTPPAEYNFAVIPTVTHRDQYWHDKYSVHKNDSQKIYTLSSVTPIHLPKNSYAGMTIAGLAFLFGFGLIWHIFWLAGLAFLAVVIAIIIRTQIEHPEEEISINTILRTERQMMTNTAKEAHV